MYALIVFLPLVGSVLAGLLSLNNQDRPAELVTVTGLLSPPFTPGNDKRIISRMASTIPSEESTIVVSLAGMECLAAFAAGTGTLVESHS